MLFRSKLIHTSIEAFLSEIRPFPNLSAYLLRLFRSTLKPTAKRPFVAAFNGDKGTIMVLSFLPRIGRDIGEPGLSTVPDKVTSDYDPRAFHALGAPLRIFFPGASRLERYPGHKESSWQRSLQLPRERDRNFRRGDTAAWRLGIGSRAEIAPSIGVSELTSTSGRWQLRRPREVIRFVSTDALQARHQESIARPWRGGKWD